MKLSTTLTLLALLGAVIGVFYFLGPTKIDSEEMLVKPLFPSLDRNDVKWAALTLDSGQHIVVRPKGVNTYSVEITNKNGVFEDRADATRVRQLFELLETAPSELVNAEPTDEDITLFGLDRPHSSIRFATSAGHTEIEFGADEADGSTCFARIKGERAVYRTGRNFKNALGFNARDFRHPYIFTLSNMVVDGFEFAPSVMDETREFVALEKGALGWRITQPFEARADSGKATGIINKMTRFKIARFLAFDPSPEELEFFGLHDPIRVTLSSGSVFETIEFGGKGDEDLMYARRIGSPQIVSVDIGSLIDMRIDPNDLRPKRVIRPVGELAVEMEARFGDEVRFQVAKIGVSDRWALVEPFRCEAFVDGDAESVDWMLSRLERIEAQAYFRGEELGDLGVDLEKPLGSIQIRWKERNIVLSNRLTFFTGDQSLFVTRDDEEDVYAQVDPEFVELLYIHPLSLKRRKILGFEEDWSETLVRAKYENASGVALEMARGESRFWQTMSDPSKTSRFLQALVSSLIHRRAARYLPPPSQILPQPSEAWLEGEPRVRLELEDEQGAIYVFELFQEVENGALLKVPLEFLYPEGALLPPGAVIEIDKNFANDLLKAGDK